MKTSELHQKIGRPTFTIGDRVKIKDTGKIGWVSHIEIGHVAKCYWYMVVDETDAYIKDATGHASYTGIELSPANS